MNKTLVVTLENPLEPGEKSLSIVSHESLGILVFDAKQPKGGVNIEDLKKAIKEIEKFQKKNTLKQETAVRAREF